MSDYATDERGAYASPMRRLAAVLIDGLLVGAVMAAVLIPLWVAAQDQDALIPVVLGAYLVLLAAAVLYEVGLVARRGATLGKQLMRVQVREADGSLPSLGISFVRYFTKFLAAAVALLGLLWALWEPRRRGWHDMIAGTVVLHARRATDAATGLDRERDWAPDEDSAGQTASARAQTPDPEDLIRAHDASAAEDVPTSGDQPDPVDASPDFPMEPERERDVLAAEVQPAEGDQPGSGETPAQPAAAEFSGPDQQELAADSDADEADAAQVEPEEPVRPADRFEAAEGGEHVEAAEGGEHVETVQPAESVQAAGPTELVEPEPELVEPEPVESPVPVEPEPVESAAPVEPEPVEPVAQHEPAAEAYAPAEPSAPAAASAEPPAPAPTAEPPARTEAVAAAAGGADPNLAAIAEAQLSEEAAAWLRQVADQVDPRLDQVTAVWRAHPQSEAARACVFGLLLGHLANTYPHMAADLSRAAEGHVSFSTFGGGNRLAILRDIAADPAKIAAWIGPLIEVEDPQQIRRLLA